VCTSHPAAEQPRLGGTSPVSPLLRTRRGMAEQAQSPHSTANCSLLGTTMWRHRYAMYTQTATFRLGGSTALRALQLHTSNGEAAIASSITAHFPSLSSQVPPFTQHARLLSTLRTSPSKATSFHQFCPDRPSCLSLSSPSAPRHNSSLETRIEPSLHPPRAL
jgi:hypothetical protein